MALNREFIGRVWKSPEIYEVSREKLRDYAVATGDLHAAYLDVSAAAALGHENIVAPPTFAVTLWFRMGSWPLSDPGLGKKKAPVCMMGEQSLTHHRPILVGDRLVFQTTVRDIRDIGKHELLEIEHQIVAVDGESVCTIVEKLISRGTAATMGS